MEFRFCGHKKISNRKKTGIIFIMVLLIIWITIYLFPVPRSKTLHKFKKERPLIIAHGGGNHLAPSNTLAAFANACELGAEALEMDIHMTSDGYLVSIHDSTVDQTTNGTGRVNDMTLEEVQALDAGYRFQNPNGEYSYRGRGAFIPTLEEIFDKMSDMDMLYIIEIKDTNDPGLYKKITEKLWEIIQEFNLENHVIIASFDQRVIDMAVRISGGKAFVSGGSKEAFKFVVLHKLFLNGLYRPKVHAFQLPMNLGPINLIDGKMIRGAYQRGMVLQYWTVNSPEKIRMLIDLGTDGIITDRPDLLIDILKNEK